MNNDIKLVKLNNDSNKVPYRNVQYITYCMVYKQHHVFYLIETIYDCCIGSKITNQHILYARSDRLPFCTPTFDGGQRVSGYRKRFCFPWSNRIQKDEEYKGTAMMPMILSFKKTGWPSPTKIFIFALILCAVRNRNFNLYWNNGCYT